MSVIGTKGMMAAFHARAGPAFSPSAETTVKQLLSGFFLDPAPATIPPGLWRSIL